MAISSLNKVYLIFPQDRKEPLLKELQKAAIIEIEKNLREEIEEKTSEKEVFSQETDSLISQAEHVIDYLTRFERKASLTEQLARVGKTIPVSELEGISSRFNLKDLYSEVHDLAKLTKEIESEETDITSRLAHLAPFKDLDVPFASFKDTHHIRMRIGSIPSDQYPSLLLSLEEVTGAAVLEKFQENYQGDDYFLLAHPREFDERINPVLARHNFKEEESRSDRTAGESILIIEERLKEIEKVKARIKEAGIIKSEQLPGVKLMYDNLLSTRERRRSEGHLYETLTTAFIKGWVQKKDMDRLREIVSGVTPYYDIIAEEPTEDPADIPVVLENPRPLKSGEVLVGMYSMPKYNELDPTIFIYPFFILFFAICMSDMGYGLILLVMSLVLNRYMPYSQFPKLMILSSIATIIVGFFAGGLFGIPRTSLPSIMQQYSINLTEHMNEFLVFALALGAFQMTFGYFIGARTAHMRKDWEKMTDNILLGIFFGSGSPLLLAGLFLNTTLSEPYQTLLMRTAAISAVIFLLYKFIMSVSKYRPKGTFLVKAFGLLLAVFLGVLQGSILSMFDAFMKFFSNMLSYSRLMALGLAGGSVAFVINMLALLIRDLVPIPIIGTVIMVIILIFGHTVDVLLNALVAFVHSARLQYVEFYPYFFEGGGRPFTPLALETKYNHIS